MVKRTAVRASASRNAAASSAPISFSRHWFGVLVKTCIADAPMSVAQQSLRRPLLLELAAGLRRRLDGERGTQSPIALAESDSEAGFAGPRPLSPILPSEL